MNRKKRTDRNHIVYKITNQENGKFYIGVTAVVGRAFKRSANIRLRKHISRARNEDKCWNLYADMRKYFDRELEVYKCEIIRIIRGKSEAHLFEVNTIDKLSPCLNTHKKLKK